MAKSMRSKWKRKMRAKKRTKNAPKEMARLKKILGVDKDGQTDIEMMDPDLVTVTDAKSIKEKAAKKAEEEAKMDVEGAKTAKYNPKTKMDENGQYPPWMGKKAMKKMKISRNNKKKGKHNKNKW